MRRFEGHSPCPTVMDGPVIGYGESSDSMISPAPGPSSPPPSEVPPSGPNSAPKQMEINTNVSSEDEQDGKEKKELSIDELRQKVRNSRWNVFFYLGLAALLFLFALIPLPVPAPWDDESVIIDAKNSDGQIFRDMPYIIGMPIKGEDFTDVTVYVDVKRTDSFGGNDILVAMIEGSCSDRETNAKLNDLELNDPNATSRNFAKIENAKVNKAEEVELQVDPGQYCLVVEYVDYPEHSSPSLEVTASVYGLREVGLILGGFSFVWAGFGFIGAQRKGRELKERTEPRKKAESVEKQVIGAAINERITAGPQSAPPVTTPQSTPPVTTPQSAPPVTTDSLKITLESQPVQSTPPTIEHSTQSVSSPISDSQASLQGNYVKSDDGYYYLLKPDNTYDSRPFILQADGTYLPYQQ